MNHRNAYSLQSRMKSVRDAGRGIVTFFAGEPNAKIHLLATVLVVVAGCVRGLTTTGWLGIVAAIAMVWITEAVNTALEKLCDFACGKQYHESIKQVKDIAAGAVLIAALCSVAIAIIVFI